MKKIYAALSLAACMAVNAQAQDPATFFQKVSYRGAFGSGAGADWTKPWANWDPNNTVYPNDPNSSVTLPVVTVSTDITSDVTWTADNLYFIDAPVHVTNGATLTIKPGTVIKGRTTTSGGNTVVGALIIARGAKINAIGTPDSPIVMTSYQVPGNRTRGDWAGFMMAGNATINTPFTNPDASARRFEAIPNDRLGDYSSLTPNDDDSSGVVRYLRIEFAGYAYLPNQELNGFTLAALGRKTHIDYVQASFSRDDSFEWFGGTVHASHLIAYAGTDDEFDIDEGSRTWLQFILGVRHPLVYETNTVDGQSNGFEHDNNTDLGKSTGGTVPGTNNPQPNTMPIISNATIIGPLLSGTTKATPGALDATGATLFNNAFELRTSVASNIYNSIAFGYPNTVVLNNRADLVPNTGTKALSDSLVIRNTTVANADPTVILKKGAMANTPFDIRNWFLNGPATGWGSSAGTPWNMLVSMSDSIGLVNPKYTLKSGVASVSVANVSDISFANTDFTLSASAPVELLQGACFAHPRLGSQDAMNCTAASLGVAEDYIAAGALMVVYPNPANDNVQVLLNQSLVNSTVTIQNGVGQVVATQTGVGSVASFNTSSLNNGIYIVNVNNGGKNMSQKLIINK